MRFVCLEVGGEIRNLYAQKNTEEDSFTETNGTILEKQSKIDAGTKGVIWNYGTSALKKYLESRVPTIKLMTISEFEPYSGLLVTTNLSGISAVKFVWNIQSYAKIQSSFWYTILTEKGVYLVQPKRLASSAEFSGDVISRLTDYNDAQLYDGESGADYRIGYQGDTIEPQLIDSVLKGLGTNKKRSQNEIIEVKSSYDAIPLDFFNDDGTIFVSVSRKEISEGLYIYTMVKESNETYTVTGADIIKGNVKFTEDGGLAVLMINKTGSPSVKGEIVRPGIIITGRVEKIIINRPDPIGVFLDSDVPDGGQAWVVVAGIAYVYVTAAVGMGYYVRGFVTGEADYVIGQAKGENVPTSPFSSDKHFYEIGHCIQSRGSAGIVKCVLHFN